MQMWIQVSQLILPKTNYLFKVASCVPSLLVAPIIGSWADKYGDSFYQLVRVTDSGRRTPLLFSMVGYLLYTIFQVAAVLTYNSVSIYQWYFMAELSMGSRKIPLLITASGLTGGFSCIMVTALAIVTDDCRHKLRPVSYFKQRTSRSINNAYPVNRCIQTRRSTTRKQKTKTCIQGSLQ